MRKVIRITEGDLTNIVKRVMNESDKEKDNKSYNDKKFEKMVDVLEILKDRWAGKDMEDYFYQKSQEFIAKLKSDLKK